MATGDQVLGDGDPRVARTSVDPYGPSDPNSTGVYFAPKRFRYSEAGIQLSENDHCVSVLSVGEKFVFVLPGFDVLSVELRHIWIKGTAKIGRPEETYDLFVRNDFDLSRRYPCEMILKEVTIVKEDDFKLSIRIDNLHLPPQGVVVIWEWEWKEYEAESSCGMSDITHISETVLESNSDETNCEEPNCSAEEQEPPPEYTVIFKCIGAQHDQHAQVILQKVTELLHKNEQVPVNIYPEPDNPFDSQAIEFKCWLDDQWHRIGYVVREALNDVHEAMTKRIITNVKFAWAKFCITWPKSGPGYYAGIAITKQGQWSAKVRQSASTR